MKLGVFAASFVLGVTSLVPASFAQGSDGQTMQERSRMPAGVDSATVGRTAPSSPTPTLESARLPAGMMPEPPAGPARGVSGTASNMPIEGSNIQRSLRRE